MLGKSATKARRKRGRPRSRAWKPTAAAAAALGLTPEELLRLRLNLLKPIRHWRCTNPTAAPKGRRYIFHTERIEPLLVPGEESLDLASSSQSQGNAIGIESRSFGA